MSDLLEQTMRETLSERAAQIDPTASARLRAIDYRPRRRLVTLPALGALGLSGTAVAVIAAFTLGSSAAPAFAGWSRTPTPPAAGQLASAAQACSTNAGTPVLTDTRGPYTATIYADRSASHTCLEGGSLSIASGSSGPNQADVPAGHIQLSGSGIENSSGQALTLVDGRIGTGVTTVTIERGASSSVQATVSGGWYLAWWPGSTRATTANITTTTGTVTEQFPTAPQNSVPGGCPAGAQCSTGYGFGAGGAGSSQQMTSGSSRGSQ